MPDAMEYEMTIRKIFKCGRFEHGANTDTYRTLQSRHAEYSAKKKGDNKLGVMSLSKSLDEYALAYGHQCGLIAGYLKLALNDLINTLSNSDDHNESVEKLSELEGDLYDANFDDINKVIIETNKILTELGMYPG